MIPQHKIAQSKVRLSAGHPVRVERRAVHRPVAPHDHEFHEISIITAGTAVHVTPHGRTAIHAGHAVVIPPGGVHAFDRPHAGEVINVYYLPEWLDADLHLLWDEPGIVPLFCSGSLVRTTADVTELLLDDEAYIAVVGELDQLLAELARATPGQAFLKSCFLKVLTLLARRWCSVYPQWPSTLAPPPVRRALSAVEQAIDTGEPFSVSAAAAKAGLSPDRYAMVFKQSLGYSPLEYYQRRRVQRACQLLIDASRSMTDIAMSLGFADAPHFCRMFKTYRGMTPRAYRKTYIKSAIPSAMDAG